MRALNSLPIRFAAVLFLAVVAGAGADLLVLKDGTRIESRGAWQEKGRQVVFTDADGKLCALRLADVDLEASRAATANATVPATPPVVAVADRAPVLDLDENDFGLGVDPDPDVPERDVVLYATSWCGWCRKTRELFASLGVVYVERDVDANAAYRLERDRLTGGEDGVPVVDWRGVTVRGFAEGRFRALAEADRVAVAEREKRQAEEAESAEPPPSDGGP